MDHGSERVQLEIDQPDVVENYYSSCASIDQHNGCRQDDLMFERKLRMLDWSVRVNDSVLGIIIVDAWRLYEGERGNRKTLKQREFYEELASKLIFNSYDVVRGRSRHGRSEVEYVTPVKRTSGVGIHMTPTNKKRKQNGVETKYATQNNCRVCKVKKTTQVCSSSSDSNREKVCVCGPATERDCFSTNLLEEDE